jgi:hypothetical protein
MTVRKAATAGSADLMGMKNPCAERDGWTGTGQHRK